MLITIITTIKFYLKFHKKNEYNVISLLEEYCNDYDLTYKILSKEKLWFGRRKFHISLHGEINKATFVSNYLPIQII